MSGCWWVAVLFFLLLWGAASQPSAAVRMVDISGDRWLSGSSGF